MSRVQRSVSAVIAVALAAAVGGCGGDDEGTIASDAPPQAVAEAAGLDGVESGMVEASLFITKLKTKEALDFHLDGSFGQRDESSPSQLAMVAGAQGQWNGRSVNASSRLTVLADRAVIAYGTAAGERSYEIDAATVDALRSKLDRARSEGGSGDPTACLQAAEGFEAASLIREPKIEDRQKEADGTQVIAIAGDLVVARLRHLLVKMAQDPDCGAQMAALGLPPADALESAKVDFGNGIAAPLLTLAVDGHGVVRELSTRFECARLNGEVFELQFNFWMREVNRSTKVTAGPGGEPLDHLLRKFGTTEEAAMRAEDAEAMIAFLGGLGDVLSGRRQ